MGADKGRPWNPGAMVGLVIVRDGLDRSGRPLARVGHGGEKERSDYLSYFPYSPDQPGLNYNN